MLKMAKLRTEVAQKHPEVESLYERLKSKLAENSSGFDPSLLDTAFNTALSAHRNQFRESGEPYITHPLEVAIICADLNMDFESVIAALLHDTVEDTPIRLTQIEHRFGSEVARKVDALTKIRKIDLFARFTGRTMSDEQARNLQKLFLAMAQDFSVLVIKIADRLHNLRTMEAFSAEHIRRKSMETMDYYVPLARRLGLHEVATEMEELCFKYLYPKEYEWMCKRLEEFYKSKSATFERIIKNIEKVLKEGGVKVIKCFGRLKSAYSTWKKLSTQRVPLEHIHDLVAIRVIIEKDEIDCYRALGLIHSIYRPIFNRFRDYIAAPKSNGYQSLHTVIAGEEGQITEVQIRTEWMDNVAEHGVAAHWKYKGRFEHARLRETFSWFKFIEELSQDVESSEEFVAKTRESLSKDEVLVLTPQGEVVSLPAGSTPLDFAYYIHTELGHSTASAKVNGAVVPLDYELRTGDVVEVIKNEDGRLAPRPEWLNIVRSPKSVLKIKRWFRTRPRRERIEVGRLLLRSQIEKEGLYPLNLMDNTRLLSLVKTLGIRNIDDLFDEIAAGKLMASDVVDKLKSSYIDMLRKQEKRPPTLKARDSKYLIVHAPVGIASDFGIVQPHGKPLRRKIELMTCCTPIEGDEIIGINNREKHRVEVHRKGCFASSSALASEIIPVEWQRDKSDLHYPAVIYVISLNRVGLLFDVLGELSNAGVNLAGGNLSLKPSITHEDQVAEFELVIEVINTEQLGNVIKAISGVKDVISVGRVFQAYSNNN